MQDSWAKRGGIKQFIVPTQLGPEKQASLLWVLKVIAKFGVSHCSKFLVAFAIAFHFDLALLFELAIAVMIRFS